MLQLSVCWIHTGKMQEANGQEEKQKVHKEKWTTLRGGFYR